MTTCMFQQTVWRWRDRLAHEAAIDPEETFGTCSESVDIVYSSSTTVGFFGVRLSEWKSVSAHGAIFAGTEAIQ